MNVAICLLSCFVSLGVGLLLGWKLTAKRERLIGYAEAVEAQLKRLRTPAPIWRVTTTTTNLRPIKGGKG